MYASLLLKIFFFQAPRTPAASIKARRRDDAVDFQQILVNLLGDS
jgi:hypothetical protein